jgi:hypothetical protein
MGLFEKKTTSTPNPQFFDRGVEVTLGEAAAVALSRGVAQIGDEGTVAILKIRLVGVAVQITESLPQPVPHSLYLPQIRTAGR